MVKIRPAKDTDCWRIVERIRPEDEAELSAATGQNPYSSLLWGLCQSRMCWTVEVDGMPVMMAGVAPHPDGPHVGVAWAVGTVGIRPRHLLMLGPLYVRLALARYDRVENWVDARNQKAIRFLRWLGADVGGPKPYGCAQLPFHPFVIRRPESV